MRAGRFLEWRFDRLDVPGRELVVPADLIDWIEFMLAVRANRRFLPLRFRLGSRNLKGGNWAVDMRQLERD